MTDLSGKKKSNLTLRIQSGVEKMIITLGFALGNTLSWDKLMTKCR